MEQEKFVKLNQPSNPNMPRDTVETLKQIQKQGLSISIVGSGSNPFSLPSPATPDTRPKQNVITVDKPPKILPRLAPAENKTQVLQPRIISPPETRVSTPRIAPQPTFHDIKAAGIQNRASLPAVSEAKSFSSSWSTSNSSTDSKAQSSVNRVIGVTPVSKMSSTPARLGQLLMTENKTPVNRNNHNTLPENKNPARISQGQRVTPGQQLIEGKMQSNQDRINNPSSPPDAKVFQVRTGQQLQRVVAQKGADGKITNQIVSNKQIEIKNTPNRVISGAKVLSESSQKSRANYIAKTDGKISINSPMISENKMINSVRMITSVSDSSASRTSQGKIAAAMRLHPNVSGVETPTTMHSKMIQSVPVQSENKMILQGKVAVSSSDMAQKSVPAFDALSDNSLGSPLSTRTIASKRTAAGLSPAKKKCVKRVIASSSDLGAKNISASESNNLNSSDDGNENEDKIFNSIKSNRVMPTGLTITPVGPSATSTPTSNSSLSRIQGDLLDKEAFRVVCPSCNNYSSNPKFCLVCKCNLNTSLQGSQQSTEVVQKLPGTQYVVTKNVTNVMVSKQIIIAPQDGMGRSRSIQFGQTVQKKILIKTTPMMTSPRSKARPRARRRYVEPVCLTLSSDDEEEHMQASFGLDEGLSQSQVFPNESEELSKSGQSSPVYQEDEENQELDDPQFPGVTDIRPMQGEEKDLYEEEDDEDEEEDKEIDDMEIEEEEEGMGEEDEEEVDESEMEEEEEEEVPPEEEADEEQMPNKGPVDMSGAEGCEDPLRCRSIRIGSFKVHPKPNSTYLNIYLAPDGLSFNAPMVTDPNKIISITLKPCDITQMYVHFGRCLPIVFIFTTPSFADSLRKSLNMSAGDFPNFDPSSNDEKEKKITFLIDLIVEEQRRFLRHGFLNDLKVRELDQKTANEILVKSTPNQNQFVRCEIAPQPFQASNQTSENQLSITPVQPQVVASQAVTVKVTPAPVQPVLKLFTYPPPPQTGGIAVTNEDLACLNEGEFLNDAIIDFYLKYVFYEKLSEYHRDKTHIFSSYFFHRLTHKPERCRSGDDGLKAIAVRRHNQVKTWTRHVDIFSKDFIIIPVNQNVHWFLAIICYPGLVPEASENPPKDFKSNKSSDNVTSTDDQEENNKSTSKEPNSTIDGNNQISDENSEASSNNSAFEPDELDSEDPLPEAPDSSTHPDKNRRRKEAPCICIFDSLNGPNRSRIATMLREYLDIEWKIRKGTRKVFDKNTMQGFIMQVPQQTNYSDCGIYLLQYVESFFENPLPYFDNPIPNLSNWFPKEKVGMKRQELTDLILGLQKKQASSTAIRKVNATENSSSSPAHTLQTENR